ncbi:MAG TPA: NERD domain-containing protein [Nostocaceae cyanobacterium]|nr:NERD domain-containing protein [Nostocaceae cyanobacterium]
MFNRTDTQTNPTSNKGGVLKVVARLTATGIISFGIGGAVIFDRYNSYWNQTIFRVQTVDFNILSHTLPTKLSYALIKKEPEEVQRTLDSNYSLFGLIVTDSNGQKIIAYSGKNSEKSSSWKAALDPGQLQNHPYDVLLDPPPVFAQWTYSDPKAIERSATSFTNQGRVIGRVYYVRGVRPTFQEDVMTLLSSPFSGSSRIQTYTTSLIACFGGTLLVWSILEFILYKKRVGEEKAQQERELAQIKAEKAELAKQKAQREAELTEERRQRELAIAEERRLRDLAIAEEKARRESELAEQKRLHDLKEAEDREQELINYNQILQIQLAERIKELQSLQKQRDDERGKFEIEANNLRISNKKLENEILKLRELIKNTSTNINSAKLQEELKQTQIQSQQNSKQKQEYEERVKQLTQQLQIIHNQQLQTSKQNEQKENELQKLQQQIDEIENARNLAKSQLESLQKKEEDYQKIVERLEEQINQQNFKEQELQNQLENLQNSLIEYQQREQLLEQRAEQAKVESERLAEEMERYIEETGRHPLNDFEVNIQESLKQNFANSKLEIQFDVASGQQGSKFTDFLLVTNKSCIVLEAKSYTGRIKPIDNVRNSGWVCEKVGRKLNILSCWGKNPYQQVKSYCDSIMNNKNLGIQSKKPVYGVVVFPKGSFIDESIKSNIGRFYRVTTLDNLTTTIQELDNQAYSWN